MFGRTPLLLLPAFIRPRRALLTRPRPRFSIHICIIINEVGNLFDKNYIQ